MDSIRDILTYTHGTTCERIDPMHASKISYSAYLRHKKKAGLADVADSDLTERQQLAIVERCAYAVEHIPNPARSAVLTAVSKAPRAISVVDQSQDVVVAALRTSHSPLAFIGAATRRAEPVQRAALAGHGAVCLKYIPRGQLTDESKRFRDSMMEGLTALRKAVAAVDPPVLADVSEYARNSYMALVFAFGGYDRLRSLTGDDSGLWNILTGEGKPPSIIHIRHEGSMYIDVYSKNKPMSLDETVAMLSAVSEEWRRNMVKCAMARV